MFATRSLIEIILAKIFVKSVTNPLAQSVSPHLLARCIAIILAICAISVIVVGSVSYNFAEL